MTRGWFWRLRRRARQSRFCAPTRRRRCPQVRGRGGEKTASLHLHGDEWGRGGGPLEWHRNGTGTTGTVARGGREQPRMAVQLTIIGHHRRLSDLKRCFLVTLGQIRRRATAA